MLLNLSQLGPIVAILLAINLIIRLKGGNFILLSRVTKLTLKNNPKEEINGKLISKKEAFFLQLSANMGVGCIAMPPIAINEIGPAFVLWVPIMAVLLSVVKFAEIIISHLYKQNTKDNKLIGGIFVVIKHFKHFKPIALILALAIGVRNIIITTFQGEQIAKILSNNSHQNKALFLGVFILIILVLSQFQYVRNKILTIIVPIACIIYFTGCFYVIFINRHNAGDAFNIIVQESKKSIMGGVVAYQTLIIVAQRYIFGSDVGIGSVAIAHTKSNNASLIDYVGIVMLDALIISAVMAIGGLTILVARAEYSLGGTAGLLFMTNIFQNASSLLGLAFIASSAMFCFSCTLGNLFCFHVISDFVLSSISKHVKTVMAPSVVFFVAVFILGATVSDKKLIVAVDCVSSLALTITVCTMWILTKKVVEVIRKPT